MRWARGLEPERSAGASFNAGQNHRRIRRAGAKQARRYFNFGNPGTGSSIDLSAQKLFQVANIKLTNVGYKGQPPALIDLMTNLMHFEIVSLELALAAHQGGYGQTACRVHRQTRRRSAGRADDRRSRICRSRLCSLVRHLCAVDDAGRARREDKSAPSTRHCKTPTSSASCRSPISRASRCR